MRYTTKTGEAAKVATDCLVVPRSEAASIAAGLRAGKEVDLALAGTENEVGSVAKVFLPGRPSRLLIVGKAPEPRPKRRRASAATPKPLTPADFRKDMRAAAAALARIDVADATVCLDLFHVADKSPYWKTRTAAQAISAATYRFDSHLSKPKPRAKLRRVGVLGGDRVEARLSVRHANALDAGLTFAKDLANQPPNVCDPTYVAAEASALAADKVSVDIVEEAQMQELGMGALLSVSQGSERPAKMVVVHYRGGGEDDAPIVLVGKGITFDTGGINLKPSAGMDEMKFDMCGAAGVLGTARAAIEAALPLNLVAIAAAAENMPSGRASRPSDIVTTMSGQTVEILNTDAEGRLVLCDALTYAERFKPRAVVDAATLTGAQVVALGDQASALYANDDALAEALASAGDTAGDRMWRMPLWDEYQSQLKSRYADMKNIGGRAAGSITAACFLSRFAKKFPWAHLDIAGTAYGSQGANGRPVYALFQYLVDHCAAGERADA